MVMESAEAVDVTLVPATGPAGDWSGPVTELLKKWQYATDTLNEFVIR